MNFQLINIGFGNLVLANEIVAVVSPESAPIKRMVQEARSRGQLNDATEGRQARAVIITDTGSPPPHKYRSSASVQPKTDQPKTDQPKTASDTDTAVSSTSKITLSAIQPETVAHRFVFNKTQPSPLLPSPEPLDSMDIKLINIGFGNIVSANRVIAIVSPESAPIKRIITDARDRGQLVDATYGRRTRAVIITDYGHIILSAIQPETVANRFVVSKDGQGGEDG
jgi:extracellular matrix regulatory protein A